MNVNWKNGYEEATILYEQLETVEKVVIVAAAVVSGVFGLLAFPASSICVQFLIRQRRWTSAEVNRAGVTVFVVAALVQQVSLRLIGAIPFVTPLLFFGTGLLLKNDLLRNNTHS